MSVQLKILAACMCFVAIIAALGGLAQQQASQMGRLAVGIYDHAFMGMTFVDQAQEEFLRFATQLLIGELKFIPISALAGDNVVARSRRMPWCRPRWLRYQCGPRKPVLAAPSSKTMCGRRYSSVLMIGGAGPCE